MLAEHIPNSKLVVQHRQTSYVTRIKLHLYYKVYLCSFPLTLIKLQLKFLGAFKIRPEIKAQENTIENKLVFESDWGDKYVLHFNLNDCFYVLDFFHFIAHTF